MPAAAEIKKKHHGRKRRIAGCVMLTLGLLIAGVWLASGWRVYRRMSASAVWHVRFGIVSVQFGEFPMYADGARSDCQLIPQEDRTWQLLPHSGYLQATDHYLNAGIINWCTYSLPPAPGRRNVVHVALWPLSVLLFSAGIHLVWSGRVAQRRANTGLCPACGYSLAGLVHAAPCPECGKGATPE